MTESEAAIVMAYTGYVIGNHQKFHEYIEKILGRSVYTHEFYFLEEEIREKSKNDFINLKITKDEK